MNNTWCPYHIFDAETHIKIVFSLMRHFEISKRIHAEEQKIKGLKISIKQRSGKNCAGSVEQFY